MIRSLVILVLTISLFVSCSTAKPASEPPPVDPVTEPTIAAAVDEAERQGSIEGEIGARTGRRIGRVAGVIAAVFGGPDHETLEQTIDRYRITRDAAEATGALIGAAKGAKAGAKRGYVLDLQFAELLKIEGVEAFRPYPDQIVVRFLNEPTDATLAAIAAVFVGREERAIDVEAAGDRAQQIAQSLVDHGVPASSLRTRRIDESEEVVLVIEYGSVRAAAEE